MSSHGDGREAIAAIEREVPDLVVLDIMLPGIDGFEICRRMRRDERLSEIAVGGESEPERGATFRLLRPRPS